MRPTPVDRTMLDRLDGLMPGMRVFTAANGAARQGLVGRLLKGFRKIHESDPTLDWLHVTIMLDRWTTGDLRPRIDLAQITREAAATLNGIARDWSALIELQAFANVNHRTGGKLVSPHVHAIVWGCGIFESAQTLADEYNPLLVVSTPGVTAIKVQLIAPSWLDLVHVVRYPFMAADRCKTLYLNPNKNIISVHESEKGDRFIRYLRMNEILSRIRQRDLMFAAGAGLELQTAALKGAEARLRSRAAKSGVAVSMQDVRQFWDAFMPRHGRSRFRTPRIIRPNSSETPG